MKTTIATKRKAMARKIGAEFIAGMERLIATAKAGGSKAVRAKHTLRTTAPEPFDLPVIGRADVSAAREALGVSQAVFAKILGASAQSVRSWEQGTKPPSGVARRLIGEIRDKPEYWRQRFRLQTAAPG